MKTESLIITPEILAHISEIDEFKGEWRALGGLAPDRLKALRRVATIESVGSSTRIEGSRLTDREVEQLLTGLETASFRSRDEEEVAGYARAMELVFESWTELTVSENHIKQLHQTLLRHRVEDAWHRGEYKKNSNSVVAFGPDGKEIGVVFETATPFDTPRRMREWAEWIAREGELNQWHPLLIIAIAIVDFLAIHPFQDGNGRLSRVLTTLMLLRAGYSYVPYSSLESVIEQNKEAYYLALRKTQSTLAADEPDWQPWLRFFLRSLVQQVRSLANKLERERNIIAPLSARAREIFEFARQHGRVTMAEAVRFTGSPRSTLKRHFRALVERGHLKLRGKGRGAWYDLGS